MLLVSAIKLLGYKFLQLRNIKFFRRSVGTPNVDCGFYSVTKRVGTAVIGVTPTGSTLVSRIVFSSDDLPELTRPKTAISKLLSSSLSMIIDRVDRNSTNPCSVMIASNFLSSETSSPLCSSRSKRSCRFSP